MYTDQPVDEAIIHELLENANWAPTHRLTEPWRFRVFRAEARRQISDYLADYYQAQTPAADYSAVKHEKIRKNPLRADTIIAICMQRDPEERVPEWEEIAAVACAVQNMWLTCTAYGLGCYWSTPSAMFAADALLQLSPGERCLGLFYVGHHQAPEVAGKRGAVAAKTIWVK